MATILDEVQSKAPLINEQQQEYQRLVASHEDLSARLDQAMQERRSLTLELKRTRDDLEASKQSASELETENDDLSTQVQTLLQNQLKSVVHRSQGSLIATPLTESRLNGTAGMFRKTTDSPAVLTAEKVITDNLVTFSDIGELIE